MEHAIWQMLFKYFSDHRAVTRFFLVYNGYPEKTIDEALERRYIENIDSATVDDGPRYIITSLGEKFRDEPK